MGKSASRLWREFNNPIFAVGLSAFGMALLLFWTAIYQLPVEFFHLGYLILLVLLGLLYVLADDRFAVPVASLLAVLILIWILYNFATSSGDPLRYSSDENTEWQLVQSLLLTGRIPFQTLEGKFAVYASFPGLEIIVAFVQLISGIRSYSFMSYAGAILSSITVLFVFVFYRRLFGQTNFAVKTLLIAAFSSSMLTYGALAIHQTLGILFMWLILFSLTVSNNLRVTGIVSFVLGSLALVVSHDLTPLLLLIVGMVYVACRSLLGGRIEGGQIVRREHLLVFGSAVIAWDAFVSSSPANVGLGIFSELSLPSGTGYVQSALTPTGTKPAWVLALIVLGLVSYALMSMTGLAAALRSKTKVKFVPLALSGGAVWLLLFTIPLGRTLASTGIQSRGLLYLYLFGSPLFVLGLHSLLTRMTLRTRASRLKLLSLFIVALSLAPAIYYGFPASVYDQRSPLTYDNLRDFAGTYATVSFAQQFSTMDELPVVWVAYGMSQGTPSLHFRRLDTLIPYPYGSFAELIRAKCDQPIILRHSISAIPDPGYEVSMNDYQDTLMRSNIVYSSGDPFIMDVPPCIPST